MVRLDRALFGLLVTRVEHEQRENPHRHVSRADIARAALYAYLRPPA
jgi:hypothetical protein